MYRGYKRRNAKLDSMSTPAYLSESTVPLSDNNFEDLKKVPVIREVLKHLHARYALLDRVITARETHGTHFYPEDLDYGHKTWIEKLMHERRTVEDALVRLARRYQEVLFQDERWFKWVTERQRDQEEVEDKLKKQIKLEAAIFRRHAKQVAERRARRSERERELLQAQDIEAVFQERLRLDEVTDDELDEWDPIEDLMEDGRSRYIDLIMHFLWLDDQNRPEPPKPRIDDFAEAARALAEKSTNTGRKIQGKKSKSKGKGKPKPKSKQPKAEASTSKAERTTAATQSSDAPEPDKSNIETRKEMHERLRRGVEKDYTGFHGPQAVGTLQMPMERQHKIAPMPENEINVLLVEISEAKLFLFCRLLLSHAALFPIAAQAQSVEDFLRHPDLKESDLREVCIRLENPSLQDVRDACADLARETDGVDVSQDPSAESVAQGLDGAEEETGPVTSDMEDIPSEGLIDFGDVITKHAAGERMKVQVCGKTIWNYASENAMTRDGWLQFSIMAKDCSLNEAIVLCRNWRELSDLNDLALYDYFPAAKWAAWGGHHFHRQLFEKGFMLYRERFDWGDEPWMATLGDPQARAWRQDPSIEQRNYICGLMNRNDPVTRRFIQYCVMNTGDYLTLVRDAKTGRIITSPPKEERWVKRRATNRSRGFAGSGQRVGTEVGPKFMKECHAKADWHVSFDDYYDIVIWDLVPNRGAMQVYNLIGEVGLTPTTYRSCLLSCICIC